MICKENKIKKWVENILKEIEKDFQTTFNMQRVIQALIKSTCHFAENEKEQAFPFL